MSLPDSVVELLQSMVRLNTVNPAVSGEPLIEGKLADHNERIAKAMGLATRRMPVAGRADNLLVTYEVDASQPWLMFESHMDTVAVEGMTIDPFGAEIRDGRMWGRGSCDTKGTGASMLWALKQYAAGGEQPNNIAVAFTVDEEIGMNGVKALVHDHWPSLGFAPLGVIVGEPTMLTPITAHNGCVRWVVKASGVAAHSSTPHLGASAISAICSAVQVIESDYIPSLTASHPMTGKAVSSVNIIRGGSQVNIIPDHAEAECDRRVVPGEDPHSVAPAVEKVLGRARAAHPKSNIEVADVCVFPPLEPRDNDPTLAIVKRALASLGLPTAPKGVAFATDAGDLSANGISAVVIGPGDIAQAHTKDEFIDLEQLERGVALYEAIMRTPSE